MTTRNVRLDSGYYATNYHFLPGFVTFSIGKMDIVLSSQQLTVESKRQSPGLEPGKN
jgi:hypothetical protein